MIGRDQARECRVEDAALLGARLSLQGVCTPGDSQAAQEVALGRRPEGRPARGGGQGAWGQVPMPPNAALPEAELQRIAAWVLQQK